MQLTIHESWWTHSGGPWGTGPVIRYEVDGLPPTVQVSIHNFGNDRYPAWRVLRINENYFSGWQGQFDTAAKALESVLHTFAM